MKQRAKNGGPNRAPVERAAIEQRLAHGGIESGDGQGFLEQLAVYIRKGGKLFVDMFGTLVFQGIEHLEKLRQLRPKVAAIGRGALVEPDAETAGGLKDAGVLGEQTEQQAYQQHFQRMACVTAGLEPVVQAAHALGGLDVDRVLRRDDLGAVTGDEAEMLDVLVQVGELERGLGIVFQIVEPEALEVGHEDVARQIALKDAVEIIRGLRKGAIKVGATALVLDQQHAFPEGVDAAVLEFLARARHGDLLLENGDALAPDAEHGEKIIPEALRLGALGCLVCPLV